MCASLMSSSVEHSSRPSGFWKGLEAKKREEEREGEERIGGVKLTRMEPEMERSHMEEEQR